MYYLKVLKQGILMNIIKKIKSLIFQVIWIIYFLFYYYFYYDKCIFVKAWVKFKAGKIVHNNWGDDLNYYLLRLISGKKVVFHPIGRIGDIFHFKCLLGIGSILSFWSLDKVTVIGSGIISDFEVDKICGKPQRVCFVRGPISRKILSDKGIEVPMVCGDLALTLPLYYKPKIYKENKLGIVLHYVDEDLKVVKQIEKNRLDIKFIHMRGYEKWTDVIDEILSCEVILSSSLHGLICAEAYKVPCQWIYFSEGHSSDIESWPSGWKLKFYDFFASIQKEFIHPVEIDLKTDVIQLGEIVKERYIPSEYDPYQLVDDLPIFLKK